MNTDIVVLKLGSSVLRDESALPIAVQEVHAAWRRGQRVVAVVSAFGRTTDRLLERARRVAEDPDPAALAALLATGEAAAVALLAIALERHGIPAVGLDADQIGLRTSGDPLDSEPIAVDAAAIHRALQRHVCVVVPGFVGRGADGGATVLGRGGSDLTALYLARELGGRCRLIKDVDGIYDGDPARISGARRFAAIGWDEALALGGRVVQPKALRFARRWGLSFDVAAAGCDVGTSVGPGPSALTPVPNPDRPLRVGLIGLGTVGLGVYRLLLSRPDRFVVSGIAIRDPSKPREVPRWLILREPGDLIARSDVIVEVAGGVEPARAWIATALAAGRHVVTANKAVIAADGPRLERIAALRGVKLLASAAVGGAVPVLETLERLCPDGIVSVEGVLNGTSNYILDRLAAGIGLEEAVIDAQARGFAEADPTEDLDGTDAARKLAVIARVAFGVGIDPLAIPRRGIVGAPAGRVRLIASVRRTSAGVEASVGPVVVGPDHPLADVRGEENRVVVTTRRGVVVIRGKGAGRWPTATSVLSDLLSIGIPAGRPAELELAVGGAA